MKLFQRIQRKFKKEKAIHQLLIDDEIRPLQSCLEKKTMSDTLFDEIYELDIGILELTVTKRYIDNGDIFLYFQSKNFAECSLELKFKTSLQIKRFDMYYEKPEYDNRYGENKVTGPLGYIVGDKLYAMASKIYYYNILTQQYSGKDNSMVYDLKEESDTVEISGSQIKYNIQSKSNAFSFCILISKHKLFTTSKSLERYIRDYFLNIKTNYVVSSFFIEPSGTYTKLPYSIEPFTKNGYGYSLHHSSKKELIPFLEETKDRYFYDMIVNAVMQATLYQKQKQGVFYTPYTSTWLKKDTGITAPYIDTRLNETFNLMLEDFHRITKNPLFKDSIDKYLLFLLGQKENVYRSEHGLFFPDYFKENLQSNTHASLNHQVGIANLACKQYQSNGRKELFELFQSIVNFIVDTGELWIKENGDLYYGLKCIGEKMQFYGNDYIYVTFIDLLRLQKNIIAFMGEKNETISRLIETKYLYLENHDYSIMRDGGKVPQGESSKTRCEAKTLYLELYGGEMK